MAEAFDAVGVIRLKRDGGELSNAQIDWTVDAYTRGAVADKQMSVLAMAIFLNKMNRREISRWTAAVIASDEWVDFSEFVRPAADKRSTGGVGDKITLPPAPLIASFGVAVPQLLGRKLDHTGGTLDKSESIAGWRANVSNEQMWGFLGKGSGTVVCTAGAGSTPADKKLYALRDITATVDRVPLITSSIMSKKIAEGTDALVLDVKAGSDAFMKDIDEARELASTVVGLGVDAGTETVALLTNMNVPLGLTVGNALEVRESVEAPVGDGPDDIIELAVVLTREVLAAAGENDVDIEAALGDGRAMDMWRAMVRQQGGDPGTPLPTAREAHDMTASRAGISTEMDALRVEITSQRLGAGCARKEDPVQAGAGIKTFVKPGDRMAKGQPILRLYTNESGRFEKAIDALGRTLTVDNVAHAPESGVSARRDAPSRESCSPNGTDDAATRKSRWPVAGKPRRSVALERLG